MELTAHAATAGATIARKCMAAVVTVRAVTAMAMAVATVACTCLAAVATVRAVTAVRAAVK